MARIRETNRRWWVLGTMTGALSMIMIDQTVVSVALPTIQRDLTLSQTELQWVVNAYILALASLVALGGRLGDLLGRPRAFRAGALTFVLGSASCGLAESEAWLIGSRAIQGAGGALMVPATQTLVTNAFSPSERGRAMGIYAGTSMVFLALGPLIGGLLTEAIGWRAVFYVNVPVGAGMLLVARSTLVRERPPGGTIDWPGAVLVCAGLGSLVLGLMESRTWGWESAATLSLVVGGVLALAALVVLELHRRQPLIELRLFRRGNFAVDNAVLAFVQFALVALTLFGALWVQNVLGFSPISAGLSLLPLSLPLVFVAPRVGRLYDRVGPRLLVGTGAAMVALAFGWDAWALAKESYAWLVPGYVAMGIGIGMVMTPTNTDAMSSAPAALRGQASGLVQTVRNVGGTLGVAIVGTVVAHDLRDGISAYLDGSGTGPANSDALEHRLSAEAQGVSDVSPEALDAGRAAFTDAVAAGYRVSAAVLLACSILAFALLRRRPAADAGRKPGLDEREAGPVVA